MPSPIAHSITGYALFKLFRLKCHPPFRRVPALLGWSIVMANAADLDFLAQLFTDARVHRGMTHSIGFTLGLCCLVAIAASAIARPWVKQILLLTAAGYGSHLLLDFFTAGGRGMQLFWPLTPAFFQSPIPLFPPVHHSHGLFYWGHLLFISYELLYAVLVMKGLDCLTLKRRKVHQTAEFDS